MDRGKSTHRHVCMRSPMESVWSEDRGQPGQSPEDSSEQKGLQGYGGA